MVGLEPSEEEKAEFVIKVIKEHGEDGKSIPYKKLQDLCADEFEGVRLLLKRMKSEGTLDFPGMMPMFTDDIVLLK